MNRDAINADLLLACKQLAQIVEEIMPQAGKLVFQDYGLLNDALINSAKAIREAEDINHE